jgi:hypothetical protein
MIKGNIISTEFEGRKMQLVISRSAQKQLDKVEELHVGMELYFSCLVKKIMNFSESQPEFETKPIADKLNLYFRPVQSKSCNIHDLKGQNEPTLITFPIVKRDAIIPSHLYIDYRSGTWKGDFTWKRTT